MSMLRGSAWWLCVVAVVLLMLWPCSSSLESGPTCSFATCPVLQTIKFAASAPLTGINALSGAPVRDGIVTAFKEYNEDWRDDKKPIRFELDDRDDMYSLSITQQNMDSIINDPSVFGILGAVDTGGIESCAPSAIQQRNFPFFGAYGGLALRHPFQRNVMTLRGSYYDEAATIVNFFVAEKRERIAVFLQNDSFGLSARDGVIAALDSLHLYLHSEGLYTKNMGAAYWQEEVKAALKNMSSSSISSLPPNAIVMAAVYEPASIFIQQMHALWPDTIVVCISSVSVPGIVSFLAPDSSVDADILDVVYSSQFLPNPMSTSSKLAARFRAAADAAGINKTDHLALEGYLMARFVIATFQLISDNNFTQAAFMDVVYRESFFNIDDFRFGPFYPAEVDGGCNQGIQGTRVVKIYPNRTLSDVFTLPYTTCGYHPKQWTKLTFGQSCTFTGDQATRCIAFRDGLLAAFKQVNDAGGIRGSARLYLDTLDDGGDPRQALQNNHHFLNDPKYFGLVGASSLGIADTVKLLANSTGKVLFGAYSGDVTLREPFQRNIVNFRTSDYDELASIAHFGFGQRRFRKFSVLYENTVFGTTRRDHLEAALGESRLSIFTEASYDKPSDIHAAINRLFAGSGSGLQAVVFIGLDNVMAQILEQVHSRNSKVLVFALSYTVALDDPAFLASVSAASSKVNLNNFFVGAVVPNPRNSSSEVAQQYKEALWRLDAAASVSFAGFEGYIVGQMLTLSLARVMRKELTVDTMLDTLYDIGNFDLYGLRCGPLQIFSTTKWSSTTSIISKKTSCNQCMKSVVLYQGNKTEVAQDYRFEDTCMHVPTKNMDFELGTTRLSMLILAFCGMLYTVVIMVGLVITRHNPQIRAMSLTVSLISCVGAILFFGWVLVLYPVPTDTTCVLQPCVLDLAFILTFSPVFGKVQRLDIASNAKYIKRTRQRAQKHNAIDLVRIYKIMAVILLVFAAFLTLFMVVDRPMSKEQFRSDGVRYEDCITKSYLWAIFDRGLKVVLMTWGLAMCRTFSRMTPNNGSHLTESKRLVLITAHSTFMAVVWLVVEFATVTQPTFRFMSVSFIVIDNTAFVVTFLFAYPVYMVWRGSDSAEPQPRNAKVYIAGNGQHRRRSRSAQYESQSQHDGHRVLSSVPYESQSQHDGRRVTSSVHYASQSQYDGQRCTPSSIRYESQSQHDPDSKS